MNQPLDVNIIVVAKVITSRILLLSISATNHFLTVFLNFFVYQKYHDNFVIVVFHEFNYYVFLYVHTNIIVMYIMLLSIRAVFKEKTKQ